MKDLDETRREAAAIDYKDISIDNIEINVKDDYFSLYNNTAPLSTLCHWQVFQLRMRTMNDNYHLI